MLELLTIPNDVKLFAGIPIFSDERHKPGFLKDCLLGY